MNIIYNFCLLFFILTSLPKWLWERISQGKHKGSLPSYLGFKIPRATASSIWLHMVSVGEVRAMIPLYERLKKENPSTEFFLSTITQTGLTEARRSLSGAKAYFLLPFDFSWTMRRVSKRLKPFLLILSEGDLWFHMLRFAKQAGARILLVSAKLSERSARRYAKVPFFAHRLFSNFDLICAQNDRYAKRFSAFSHSIKVTGNLKYDTIFPKLSVEEKIKWQKRLKLQPDTPVLVIGSTHQGEEEILLPLLESPGNLKILLVPRHPERFDRVFSSLPSTNKGRFTQGLTGNESIILIDAMGLLSICYQLGKLAIVGGSFVPGIGGHNILEPIHAHIPVLFGPYMEAQMELVKQVLISGSGIQLQATELVSTISSLLEDALRYRTFQEKAVQFTQEYRGTADHTWNALFP